jgi:DNA-binding transcriptional regulator GbsR (MarR family)
MERQIKLKDSQRQLIERLGVAMEKGDTTPIESRIMALLVVCDITALTFDEIYQTLQISKSATSNAINKLMANNKIEYITLPGDRKRYFKSRFSNWEEGIQKNFNKMFNITTLMQEVIDQRPKDDVEFNQSLTRFVNFLVFMQAELPKLYERWKAEHLD